MKKLSNLEMKKIIGGIVPAECSHDCPKGSKDLSVSCPSGTKACSVSGDCVTCDGNSTCCVKAGN